MGRLLELSLGLSAWKQYGPNRWALRCNPSSGNLHPTEGYLVCRALPDFADGVYHYRPDAHLLEQRAAMVSAPSGGRPAALLGLASIHWREAWKYGKRAYRYCQLDVGHAVAALSYAAALLGWRLRPLTHWPDAAVAALLGVDQPTYGAEPEHPDLLLAVDTEPADEAEPDAWLAWVRDAEWRGRPNVLDRRPLYRWPVIEAVSRATAKPATPILPPVLNDTLTVRPAEGVERPAMAVIRERRSAQAYDPAGTMPLATLETLLDRLIPRTGVPPWDALPETNRLHPLLFVHRVGDLAPGLYALPRSAEARALLLGALDTRFAWNACPEVNLAGNATLYRLASGDMRRTAGLLCCHQAIAAQGAVTLMLLAESGDALDAEPWRYRWRHWEAGVQGQVLYLNAEAAGLRGTGIGCYFDPAVHEVLGLSDRRLQSFYHFTIGRPLVDARIQSLPPYANLQRD
ncbi:MAG TPA: nitroreductase family protein [Candidatus Acidoferrales bacterium]|nr:nitroreductase family protein [Candidatus Acidoferrales bacterium]